MLQGIQLQSNYHMSNFSKNVAPSMVPIAPAQALESKYPEAEHKKYIYKSNPYTGVQAASIARRNARERNRVKQVNDGFNALRKRLPASVIAALSGGARRGSGKKLSKVDTLRMVVEYIRYLENLIDDSDSITGTHNSHTITNTVCYEDEGVFGGSSPYSESVPSPVDSECSSGVSSIYSSNNYVLNSCSNNVTSVEEDDIFDTMSWWQQK